MSNGVVTRTVLTLAILGLAIGCGAAGLRKPTDAEILEKILPSAAQIVLEQPGGQRFRTASGVTIAARRGPDGPECLILTAAHTFSEAEGKALYVVFGSHTGRDVKVAAQLLARRETENIDLALLQARSDQCVAAGVHRPAMLGEWVWVVAFPWGRRVTLARGVVSQVDLEHGPDDGQDSQLMVDASVSYGASGAGVYAARSGGLVGVVQGYSTARVSSHGASPWHIDVPVPGQTFVTSLRQIRRFLNDIGYASLLRSPSFSHR